MGGVNLHNFIWIVQDLRFDLQVSQIPNYLLLASLLMLIPVFGRKLPLLEAILAVMLVYFLFGKVINEQFPISIFPLMMLSKECESRIWAAPFVFIFLRSPFYYFAIIWMSPVFYSYYLQADTVWMQPQAPGYLEIPMYAVGIAFSLLVLRNLLRVMEARHQQAVSSTETTMGLMP
jgi:hypothetical protein